MGTLKSYLRKQSSEGNVTLSTGGLSETDAARVGSIDIDGKSNSLVKFKSYQLL